MELFFCVAPFFLPLRSQLPQLAQAVTSVSSTMSGVIWKFPPMQSTGAITELTPLTYFSSQNLVLLSSV